MNVRVKGLLIMLVFAAAVFYSLPTYQAYQPGIDPQQYPNRVNLGLDLQGGMYLDIEIKGDGSPVTMAPLITACLTLAT